MHLNLRKEWFQFVATTRKRLQRKSKKAVSHREAMSAASSLWGKEKEKLLRKHKRQEKKGTTTPSATTERCD